MGVIDTTGRSPLRGREVHRDGFVGGLGQLDRDGCRGIFLDDGVCGVGEPNFQRPADRQGSRQNENVK